MNRSAIVARLLVVIALVGGCGEATQGNTVTATDVTDALAPDTAILDAATKADSAATDSAATDATPSADTPAADATPLINDGTGGPDAAPSDAGALDVTTGDTATGDATTSDAASADAGPWKQPPVWDLTMIQDSKTAKCTFSNKHTGFKNGVSLDVWDLTYRSWESIDGKLKPIQIKGFAARPKGSAALPGVVQAHGLGGYAKESHATGVASVTGMFVIAYTGPGGGTNKSNSSEGLPSGYKKNLRIFDVIPDVRGSWFWGHTVAAMRAITCMQTRPDVDMGRIGITGVSAGGVVSHLASGHDPRIKAAVPLSGVLAWDVATESPKAWQNKLLKVAGLSIQSPRWIKMMQTLINPSVALAGAKAKVFEVDGSSDEFFPLTALLATWKAWPAGDHRMSIVANFDHGVYQVYGKALPGGTAAIKARAELRAAGAQRAWFRHWFKTDSTYATLPKTPVLQVQAGNASALLTAVVDPGNSALVVDDVRVWWSNDKAKLWGDVQLKKGAGGLWTKFAPIPVFNHTLMFVDVTYKTKALLPERFSLSSVPQIPKGFVPDIWGKP